MQESLGLSLAGAMAYELGIFLRGGLWIHSPDSTDASYPHPPIHCKALHGTASYLHPPMHWLWHCRTQH